MFASSAHVSATHRLFRESSLATAFAVLLPGLILSSPCEARCFDNTLACTLLSHVSLSLFFSLSLPLSNPRRDLTSLQKKGIVLLFCMHSIPSPFSTDVEVCSASHFHSAPLPLLRLAFCLIRSWWRWRWQYSSSGDDSGGMSGVGCQEQSEMIGACQNAIWRLR